IRNWWPFFQSWDLCDPLLIASARWHPSGPSAASSGVGRRSNEPDPLATGCGGQQHRVRIAGGFSLVVTDPPAALGRFFAELGLGNVMVVETPCPAGTSLERWQLKNLLPQPHPRPTLKSPARRRIQRGQLFGPLLFIEKFSPAEKAKQQRPTRTCFREAAQRGEAIALSN